ncbi:Autophagy-related protein 16 [Cocos nucifera]|nr:Autophagy-related protein 16 [Cocos nucifera]
MGGCRRRSPGRGLKWKKKAKNLELEPQQCFRARARLSEQLVVEVAECRNSKAVVQEKEELVSNLQDESTELRDENSQLKKDLEEMTKVGDLLISENKLVKAQLEEVMLKLKDAEAENKKLIDRWMLEKMKDAEKLNEANALHEDMMQRFKVSSIEQLARQQVDGVIRRSEAEYVEFGDQLFLLFVIAASSSNNMYVWDVSSSHIRHTLTSHTDKVCTMDASKASSRNVVSAAYDHTVKIWNLQKGYYINTIILMSNCNAVSYNMDGLTICSDHVDGNLRLWDSRTGKLISEVAAHSQVVTSIYVSRSGNLVLTSGRDNLHNLFDVITLEVCRTFRANGNRVASNWSRSCISVDENYVAAGSADGSIHVWSRLKADTPSILEGHSLPILSCSWSGF